MVNRPDQKDLVRQLPLCGKGEAPLLLEGDGWSGGWRGAGSGRDQVSPRMYLPRQNSESGPPEQVLVAPSDFRRFAESVLVSPKGYAGTRECPIPAELEVPLPIHSRCARISGSNLAPAISSYPARDRRAPPARHALHRLGEPEPSGLPGRCPRRVLGRARAMSYV
jgi:hypothetical protein